MYDLDDVLEEVTAGDAQLLDVREINEWEDGHLEISTLVPLSELQAGSEPNETINRDKKTYLHCRSGQRVYLAQPLLEGMGFSNVTPLDEGFEELVMNEFPEA